MCHMPSTMPEKYSQVKCVGLWFCFSVSFFFNYYFFGVWCVFGCFLFFFFYSFIGFPLLLLCIVCGHKLFCTWLSCFSSESLVMLQLWWCYSFGDFLGVDLSPLAYSLLSLGFPFKCFIQVGLEASRECQNSYARTAKLYCGNLVWPEGVTYAVHVLISGQWSWWAWCSLSIYYMYMHFGLRNCN